MRAFLTVLFISLLLSCKKEDPDNNYISHRTLLIYMAGDNDLSRETEEKIQALRKAYRQGMGRLLIYQDLRKESPRLLEVSAVQGQNEAGIKVVRTYSAQNSASSEVFKRVLDDLKQMAPSTSYGLILFSHASGWLPSRTLTRPSAVAQDGNDDLELGEFARVIPDGFFGFMIFEACFMSGIEVLYELRDKAEFLVGSSAEILSPGFTPLYGELLPFLYLPDPDLKGFAGAFFNYYNKQAGDYRSATISVIKSSELPDLAAWVRTHAKKTLPSSSVSSIQHFDRYTDYRLFYDFEEYYELVSDAADHTGLRSLLDKAVIYKAATPQFMPGYSGFTIRRFSGITTYIRQDPFPFLNEEYNKLLWSKSLSNK